MKKTKEQVETQDPLVPRKQRRYLTKLQLENYQDHKDTTLELKPGINLITGSSDVGKSAILRGFNFLMHNLPRGKSFIYCGQSEAIVTGWFNDGTIVQRIKGDRNAVLVTDEKGNQTPYDSFGHILPKGVEKALGNPPKDSKHGPIAYAEQMAPLFLVSLTETDLPRTISELTGIDDFEEAAKLLNSRAKKAGAKAKESDERMRKLDEELLDYKDLDDQVENLKDLESKMEKIEAAEKTITQGENILQRYNMVMAEGRKANKSLKQAQSIVVHADLLAPIQQVSNSLNSGERLLERYSTLEEQERTAKKALVMSSKIAETCNIDSINIINVQIQKGNQLSQSYKSVMDRGKLFKKELDDWTKTKTQAENDYNLLVEEMRSTGLWCNGCNRPLSEDICEH